MRNTCNTLSNSLLEHFSNLLSENHWFHYFENESHVKVTGHGQISPNKKRGCWKEVSNSLTSALLNGIHMLV